MKQPVYLGYWDGKFQFGTKRGERKPPPLKPTNLHSNYRSPKNGDRMEQLRAGWH